ncbi:MAG: nitroreductase [Syntrophales bacterium]|nr:nitroreductase [Syntrophales bacterium]MDD5232936.1 nitroreductase [Syntrophales bacterium]MDD5532916.1 nitroreductase [Syntrophales bacterium]
MEIADAVTGRRSIRKFKKDPIPETLIREILEQARWSPSWGNTQPWELYVITGKAMEAVKEENRRRILDGSPPCPDIPMPLEWPDRMKARYMGVGKSVLTALDIAREDKESRSRYNADMFHLFDAPCLIVAAQDKSVSSRYALIDIGLILQNICLLAHGKGLGTCIMAVSIAYPDVLRSIAKIPEDRIIVMGVVAGYPEGDSAINTFKRQRTAVDDFVSWIK